MKRITTSGDQWWTFDLLPEALTELGIAAKSILHVGAHRGEEVPIYQQCGFERITLVEPDPENAEFLRDEFPGIAVVQCAVGESEGTATFYRAENTMYSGLNPVVGSSPAGSFEVSVRPLRDIQAEHPANVLVIDTQGSELAVLDSAALFWVDLIIMETQDLSPEAYAAYWPEAVKALYRIGFSPAIRWEHEYHFADTLFVPSVGSHD